MNMARHQSAGRTLVVGASHSGIQFAARLRANEDNDSIAIVGAEPHFPYQRPPLSKEALLGKISRSELNLRASNFYSEQKLDLLLGERVEHIERDSSGGVARLASGQLIEFSRLALAMGCRARRLDVDGSDLPHVLTLRSLDDLSILSAALFEAQRVTVVGGGFLGLEVAAAARALGKEVTVVVQTERLMRRAVGKITSNYLHEMHATRGVRLILRESIVQILAGGDGSANEVLLSGGRSLTTDLVVVAIGATPCVELAETMGLRIDDGIVVDESCLTSDKMTVAIGDCARCPNPGNRGAGTVRLESINAALEQAEVAARVLTGQRASYNTPPWFWTNQYETRVQMVGLASPTDQAVLRGDPREGAFSVLFYNGEYLTTAECVNQPVDFLTLRKLVTSGGSIPPERAGNISMPLKKLVTS